MSNLDQSRARILIRHYQSLDSNPASSALYSNLRSGGFQKSMEAIALVGTEVPALVGQIVPGDWLVVTSRRVLISHGEEWLTLAPEQIKLATADLEKDWLEGNIHKKSWRSMKIGLADGSQLKFKLAGGENLLGLASAISWLAGHPYSEPDPRGS